MQMKPIISNLPRPVQETQQHLTEGNGRNYVKCQRKGPCSATVTYNHGCPLSVAVFHLAFVKQM